MNGTTDMAAELRETVRGKVIENALMARNTTMRVGGPADVLFAPAGTDDLIAALDMAEARGWPVSVIGAGSNLIVRDGGIEGLVVLIRGTMDAISVSDTVVTAGAGLSMNRLAHEVARNGLTGLEWAVSIPGTVGGSLAGNAGAFGSCMADSVVETTLRLPGGVVEKWDNERIKFHYRGSKIPPGAIAIEVVFQLEKSERGKIEKRMKEIIETRKITQPIGKPSSGSIFRNPEGASAGRIIDELGLKGKTRGGAMVSRVHANFIVNMGDATASDVIGLIEEVRNEVKTKRGIDLVPEVRIVGRKVAS